MKDSHYLLTAYSFKDKNMKYVFLAFFLIAISYCSSYGNNTDSTDCKVVTTSVALKEYRVNNDQLSIVLDSIFTKLKSGKVLGHTIPYVKRLFLRQSTDSSFLNVDFFSDSFIFLDSFFFDSASVVQYKGAQILLYFDGNAHFQNYVQATGNTVDYIIYDFKSTKYENSGCLSLESTAQEVEYMIYKDRYMFSKDNYSYNNLFFFEDSK